MCQKYGKKYTKELDDKIYGGTDKDVSNVIVKTLNLPTTVDEFEKELMSLSNRLMTGAPVQKGAKRLLLHLHKHKIPLALATNATEEAVRLHAEARPEVFNLFHHKVTISDPDVYRGKPNPDIFLVAASRFPDNPKPSQCLVFEDSPTGVKAARQAGMQVVMIPDPQLDCKKTQHATLIIRSLKDFIPEQFGLPPFKDIFQ